MLTVLAANPLVLLFTVIGTGDLIGDIRIRGFRLGVAAVLFAGIAFGTARRGGCAAAAHVGADRRGPLLRGADQHARARRRQHNQEPPRRDGPVRGNMRAEEFRRTRPGAGSPSASQDRLRGPFVMVALRFPFPRRTQQAPRDPQVPLLGPQVPDRYTERVYAAQLRV